MKLYCISGLGADHRIFANLQLNNVSVRHIHWEEPLPNHNLSDYAKTLLSQISDPEPILLGVSFGGLIAIEMTRWIKPLKIFLVSSIKTRNEMPSLYRFAGNTGLYRIAPTLLRVHNQIANVAFGVKSSVERQLLGAIMRDTHPSFLTWAINQLVRWNWNTKVDAIVHIHGTKDRMFPAKRVQPHFWIDGGGHFMIYNRASDISHILNSELESCGVHASV